MAKFLFILALSGALMVSETFGNLNKLVKVNNKFAMEYYQQVIQGREGKNILFSPLSVSLALAMTYGGARGDTADQIKTVMHFAEITDKDDELHETFYKMLQVFKNPLNQYKMEIANKLYGRENFTYKADFKTLIGQRYGSSLDKLHFSEDPEEARETINSWVAGTTDMKILEFLAEGLVDEDTFLVLADAVRFVGIWRESFISNDTERRPFFKPNETYDTETMYTEADMRFRTIPSLKSKVLEIPYAGDKVSMFVVLPWEDDGINDLEKALINYDIEKIFKNLTETPVKALLPKFTLEEGMCLKCALMRMGIENAFNKSTADLSGIVEENGMFISVARHEAYLEVNEKGKDPPPSHDDLQANVTASGQDEPLFDADHPFLFLIREKDTGAILFVGRLSDPVKMEVPLVDGAGMLRSSWLLLAGSVSVILGLLRN